MVRNVDGDDNTSVESEESRCELTDDIARIWQTQTIENNDKQDDQGAFQISLRIPPYPLDPIFLKPSRSDSLDFMMQRTRSRLNDMD
jgi:hypothetical protein